MADHESWWRRRGVWLSVFASFTVGLALIGCSADVQGNSREPTRPELRAARDRGNDVVVTLVVELLYEPPGERFPCLGQSEIFLVERGAGGRAAESSPNSDGEVVFFHIPKGSYALEGTCDANPTGGVGQGQIIDFYCDGVEVMGTDDFIEIDQITVSDCPQGRDAP